jgi:hypothetical protein
MPAEPDHLDLARALPRNPGRYPDPEAELARLRDLAPEDERFIYEMLFAGLALSVRLAADDDRNPA